MSEELKENVVGKVENVTIEVEDNDKKVTIDVEGQEEQQVEDTASDNTEEAPKEEKKEKSSFFGKGKSAKLKEEIEDLETKNGELKDKYLRLFADFDNYKKRMAKERIELMNTAGKDILQDFLPVLDDFGRAIEAVEKAEDVATAKEGMELIFNKLKNNLTAKGLKPMESTGENFDPEFHEALTEIPAPTEELKGKVVDTIEKGYYLNDRIIRYAKVVVGK